MAVFSKILAKPLDPERCQLLIEQALARIEEAGAWVQVWLFGSAGGGQMTDNSDLDFVLIYPDELKLKAGRKLYHQSTKRVGCNMDVLFVTQQEFNEKAEIGGVYFVCKRNGRLLRSRDFSLATVTE